MDTCFLADGLCHHLRIGESVFNRCAWNFPRRRQRIVHLTRRSKKEIVIRERGWSCSSDRSEADTSTAILKSIIETLVFLCQQTCTVVLPRCGDWRSSEVRDALRSSSDSWSTVVSSGDSMKCREKASFFLYATTYITGKIKQINSVHNTVN